MSVSNLLTIQFERARVQYTEIFEILVDGPLWPREMQAALEIIKIYKEQNKIANGVKKEGGK